MSLTEEYYTPRDGSGVAKILPQIPDVIQTFNKYNLQMKNIRTILYQSLQNEAKNAQDFDINNGISFLQLRVQTLLQYNLNLLQYLLLRGEARQIKNHPVVGRLAHLRLVLEMTKPIATQLQTQINQILEKSAYEYNTKKAKEDDTPFKANTVNPNGVKVPDLTSSNDMLTMIANEVDRKSGKASGDDETTAGYSKNKQSYEEKRAQYEVGNELELPADTAPGAPISNLRGGKKRKLMTFDEVDALSVGNRWADDRNNNILAQERLQEKQKRLKDNIREKATYSALVRDLREELSERPMEQSTSGLSMHHLNTREQKERKAFEEENFLRINDRKNDRKKQRHLEDVGRLSGMADMEDMADYSSLYKIAGKKRK